MNQLTGLPDSDYDLRGYYKYSNALSPPVPGEGGLHLTDLYKLPNHPTFSNESAYATGTDAKMAGHWMFGPVTQYGINTDTSNDRKGANSAAYIPSLSGLLRGKKPKLETW